MRPGGECRYKKQILVGSPPMPCMPHPTFAMLLKAPSSRLATPPSMNLAGAGGGKGPGGGKRLCATGGNGGSGDDSKPSGLWGKYLELLDSHPASDFLLDPAGLTRA